MYFNLLPTANLFTFLSTGGHWKSIYRLQPKTLHLDASSAQTAVELSHRQGENEWLVPQKRENFQGAMNILMTFGFFQFTGMTLLRLISSHIKAHFCPCCSCFLPMKNPSYFSKTVLLDSCPGKKIVSHNDAL